MKISGCLDDIRLEGKHLPLPPAMNGTQWGQATMARNLERNCPSNKPCANVICQDPFECIDLWNEYDCTWVSLSTTSFVSETIDIITFSTLQLRGGKNSFAG